MSGSGKSTLINNLSGFLIPKEGEITFDGQKMTALRQPDWQQQLVYIPQNPYIYRMTFERKCGFLSAKCY